MRLGKSITVNFVMIGALLTGTPVDAQVWGSGDQALADAVPQANAHLGFASVAADFNADGYTDLVVAAPAWDDGSGHTDGGRVVSFFGGPGGLGPPVTVWDYPVDSAYQGAVLAAGHFDDGDRPWLAIGIPYDQLLNPADGRVVLRRWDGSAWALQGFLALGYSGVAGASNTDEYFGTSFAVGDFDGDGYDDLATGAPGYQDYESSTTFAGAGAVSVLYGSPGGLTTTGQDFLRQNCCGLGGAQSWAGFGSALAAGDFDADGKDDLAVGVPNRDVAVGGLTYADAGEVWVVHGSTAGLESGGTRLDDGDLGDAPETADRFGAALAAADFNQAFICFGISCYDDLAIGVPGESSLSGRVVVTYGGEDGLDPTNRQELTQWVVDTFSAPEAGDGFGTVLRAGNLDERIGADLAIDVPYEDVGSTADQGIVHLVYGGASGLLTYPGQVMLSSAGLASAPGVTGDHFGLSIAIGDFGRAGHADVAFGLPGREVAGQSGAGLVQVVYGGDAFIFGDGFETGGSSRWSATVP